MRRTIVRLAPVLLALLLPAAGLTKAAPPRPFEDYGMITEAGDVPGEGVRIKLFADSSVYVVRAADRVARTRLVALINQASDNFRAVTIQYDGRRGTVDPNADLVAYPACAITLDSVTVRFDSSCLQSKLDKGSPDNRLGLAVASVQAGDFAGGAQLTRELLAARSLDARRKRLLRLAQADALSGLADNADVWSPAADRLNVAALADYRIMAELAPDEVEHQFSIGQILEELGDFAGAKATAEGILKRWPEQDYRVTVRLAGLERRQGNLAKALELLDGLLARSDKPGGMRLLYNRAWTLSRMGRHAEAIADLDAALSTQPDYAYAVQRRSCDNASLGRLPAALADIDKARALLVDLPLRADDRWLAFDAKRMAAISAQLTKAIARGETKPLPETCGGYWGRSDEVRTRSSLLPA